VNLIITEEGPSVLGLDGLRALRIELTFSLSSEPQLPDKILFVDTRLREMFRRDEDSTNSPRDLG